jgi:hypothetical protein
MICSSACRLLLNSSGAQLFTAKSGSLERGEGGGTDGGQLLFAVNCLLDLGFGFGVGGSFLDFVNRRFLETFPPEF